MRTDIEEIRKIIESIPENFHILQNKTDWSIHADFINLTEKLTIEKYEESKLINESQKLFSDKTSNDSKKELLVRLGCSGAVKSYKILEKFYHNCNEELKSWAAIALQESYILLESKLTDNNSGFISTGLGGKDNCLRFFFVIISTTTESFNVTEKNVISLEFQEIGKKLNSKVENIDFHEDYSCLTVLIPMDVAPDTFIMSGIHKCRELDDFVLPHYFVTNLEIPTKSEILDIIKRIRKDLK